MKVKVVKTKDYAAAFLPGGSVIDAGSGQELRLKLACLTDGVETTDFRLRGKKGMKEAVLATVGSSDPGSLYYAFCAAYLAKGKPAMAYAYMKEAAMLGTADFLYGAEITDDAARNSVPYAHRRVQCRFVEKVMRHPLYRKVREMIGTEIYGSPAADWKSVHKAAETLKWDGEKDGKEILEAALANPSLK
jgi:hypothetical protein